MPNRNLYFGTTNGSLQYNKMVISKTPLGAFQSLKKWWDSECKNDDGRTFDQASDYYGFYISSKPIKLDESFDI